MWHFKRMPDQKRKFIFHWIEMFGNEFKGKMGIFLAPIPVYFVENFNWWTWELKTFLNAKMCKQKCFASKEWVFSEHGPNVPDLAGCTCAKPTEMNNSELFSSFWMRFMLEIFLKNTHLYHNHKSRLTDSLTTSQTFKAHAKVRNKNHYLFMTYCSLQLNWTLYFSMLLTFFK